METHYNNLNPDFEQIQARQMVDNSGLKLQLTQNLRPNDAGVLSIGKRRTTTNVSIVSDWPRALLNI